MNNNSAVNLPHDEYTPCIFEQTFSYPVSACATAITSVAVFGNLLVCLAILANRHLRINPTDLFILSLALSDFLAAIIVMPFDIELLFRIDFEWNHGEAFCIIWQVMYLITIPISVFSLLAISVDRYKTLRDPLARFKTAQFLTQKRASLVIMVIWPYSILWALFVFMGWREKGEPDDKDNCMLPYTKEYNILSSFFNIIFPLMITCIFYILIYRIAVKNNQFTKRDGFPSIREPTKEEKRMYFKNVKAAKTTATFLLALFFCWQPYCYFIIVETILGKESFPCKVYMSLLWLGYFNSALNPFLYAFSNNRFKATFRNLFTSLKPALKPAEPALSLRRLSTFSQSTVTSEIPELENGVRLRSVSSFEN